MELGRNILLPALLSIAGCGYRGSSEPAITSTSTGSLSLAEERLLLPPDFDDSEFGFAVGASEARAVVSAPNVEVDGIAAGAVFTYTHTPSGWSPDPQPLTPPARQPGQRFGTTVAHAGEVMAVAARSDAGDETVWVFRRDGDGWTLPEATLTLADAPELKPPLASDQGASYGQTLAVDGTTLLVGALNANDRQGVVYAYAAAGGVWGPSAPLQPDPEFANGSQFGSALAIDGNQAVIGAMGEEGARGAIYVLTRADVSAAWDMVRIPAPEERAVAFGAAVAISGTALAVGAAYTDESRGAAYVFHREGRSWISEPALVPSLALDTNDYFGWSLGFSAKSLFVGAPNSAVDSVYSGRIHVFARDGLWTEQPLLSPQSDVSDIGFYGGALAVTAGGMIVTSSAGRSFAYLSELGTSCEAGVDCASGYCADGVCCNQSCDDGCHSCLAVYTGDAHGTDGTCEVADVGEAPHHECAFSPDDPCGPKGWCDGNGRCATPDPGQECSKAHCATASEAIGAGYCNKKHECVLPGPTSCESGYRCRSDACATECRVDRDCDEDGGFVCFNGACAIGGDCRSDSDCASGHCSEGVCCDESCQGPCQSCLASRTGRERDGICAAVQAGTNPRGGCDDAGGRCGHTGLCDGDGTCAFAAEGSNCSTPECVSSVKRVGAGECDGAGTCVLPATTVCDVGYACAAGECRPSCDDAGDCDHAHGYYCLEHVCVVGRQCSSDEGRAYDDNGLETPCSRSRCRDGQCLESCERSAEDCAPGFACNPAKHTCVPEGVLKTAHTSGGCWLSPLEGPADAPLLALALVMTVVVRRAARNSQSSGSRIVARKHRRFR